MDFDLTQEQELLRTTARELLERECPLTLVRATEKEDPGYSPALWSQMAELGWLGLVYPDAYGGVDASFLDLVALLEEMGSHLVPGPYLASVLSGYAIMDAGSDEQKERFLPAMAAGELIVVPAVYEALGQPNEPIRATSQGDGYRLDGARAFVEFAHVANYLLVPAAIDGGNGVSLFLVDAKAPGIRMERSRTIDSGQYYKVFLDGVTVSSQDRLGSEGQGESAWHRLLQRGAVGTSAWMVGGARWIRDTTVEYAKQRVQFDKPIGSFQAIQHKCANIAVEYESARFLTYEAAWRLTAGLPCDAEVAMAKGRTSDAYRRLALEAHQVHGAIGFTWEYDLHLYTRRAKVSELFYGNARAHRERVAELLGI
jgi:alkylation response protein AidB-like acyl-CoA dehydrogenase